MTDEATPGWLPGHVEGLWDLLATVPLVLALVIVLVGILVAVVARWLVLYVGMQAAARTRTTADDKLVRLVAGVVPVVIIYGSLVAAVQALPLGAVATTALTRVLFSLLVLYLMRATLRAAHIGLLVLSGLRERFPFVEERTIPLFEITFTLITVAIAGYVLLQIWHIDATAWLASAGVIGIAVGFAARDTLANLFAGFFIIADEPYKMGDYIVLDGGERGEVTKVGIRSTRLLTRDDVEVIIPNSEMANTKVVNESGGRWIKFRIRVKVGVAYGSDVDRVVEILEGVAAEHGSVVKDPAPRVRMRAFGDSSLDFELLCWVNHPAERGLVTHELLMDIYKTFGWEGIQIPFPQRDLWIKEAPKPARDAVPAGDMRT